MSESIATATAEAPARGGGRLVRAGNRPADAVAFEQTVVSFFVDAAELLGVPKSVAAIYGICFASPEPLGFSEIGDRLDLSAGSISQGLRVLRDAGALKVSASLPSSTLKAHAVGDAKRRDYYEPDVEMRKLLARFLETRLLAQLASGQNRLEAMKETVPATTNEQAKVLQTRLKHLQGWHNKARGLLPIMKTFLKL